MFTKAFEILEEMQRKIFEGNLDGFEAYYRKRCEEIFGKDNTLEIEEIDFSWYRKKLKKIFKKILKKAGNASAIYFEYSLDNEWRSNFFVCDEYHKLDKRLGDDWACVWAERFEGPDFEQLSEIYLSTDNFCETQEATAITMYLIARTISSFAKIVSEIDTGNLAITMGFHDQEPIMRIKEISR